MLLWRRSQEAHQEQYQIFNINYMLMISLSSHFDKISHSSNKKGEFAGT